MSIKRILVTGGAGFIGSHLCKKLICQGHIVICLDNCITGDVNNIAELIEKKDFTFIRRDIVEPPPALEIDEVYHLACPASPVHYQKDPLKTLQTNVIGTINVLNLACKQGAKVLYASTSEVYGDPLVHPQREDYWGHVNPVGVRSCYDEGKRCAETFCFEYHRRYRFPIKIVRIFNTYGPGMNQRDGRVVSNFIIQALNNEDITIYGTGRQTRSFCYVDDIIEGLLLMMNTKTEFTGPTNLGNPTEFSVLELADKVIQLTSSKSQMVFRPLPEDDPQQRRPDISLAQAELAWRASTTIDEGLKRTIAYFNTQLLR